MRVFNVILTLVVIFSLATALEVATGAENSALYDRVTVNAATTYPDSNSTTETQGVVDASYSDKQWALTQIGVPSLWNITKGDPAILVAVLDTGIDEDHEDLAGQVVARIDLTTSPTPDDVYGHGTHIAGIIAAKDNSLGIVGVAPDCRLLNVKVADDKGRCQAEEVAEGIIWAVNSGANVINISLELKEQSPELESAVNYAYSHGAIVICAAGNEGGQEATYPAYYENCIAVAAIRQDDSLAPLSNRGDWIDVAAPGFNIYSTLPDNGYGYKTGTSFAAAYVSGIAALLFSLVSDANGDGMVNDEVQSAIKNGCQEIDISGVDIGRLDATKIIAQVSRGF